MIRPSTMVVAGAYWMSLMGTFGRPLPSSVQITLVALPRSTTGVGTTVAVTVPVPLLSRIGLSGSAGAVVSKRVTFAANRSDTAGSASSTWTRRLAVVAAFTRNVRVLVGASHATVSKPAATPNSTATFTSVNTAAALRAVKVTSLSVPAEIRVPVMMVAGTADG